MSRILLIAFLLSAAILSAQQTQPTEDTRSLAERAAAAHKNATTGNSSTTTFGQAANCGYNNESIGLELKCPNGWKVLSEGQMNVARAMTKEITNEQTAEASRRMVKFMMHDQGGGANVVLTLTPMLIKEAPDQLKAGFMQGAKSSLPGIRFSEEKTTLGDAAHQFVAMRGLVSVKGGAMFQSYQLLPLKGYLLTIIITSGTEDQLDDLVSEIRAHMVWTAPAATPTP